MKRVPVKVKGTPNYAPEQEHRLSNMDAKPNLGTGAPDETERSYNKLHRKSVLGASQHPTEPKEGFADDAPMMGPMRGFF